VIVPSFVRGPLIVRVPLTVMFPLGVMMRWQVAGIVALVIEMVASTTMVPFSAPRAVMASAKV
jgi:hypothetical protein